MFFITYINHHLDILYLQLVLFIQVFAVVQKFTLYHFKNSWYVYLKIISKKIICKKKNIIYKVDLKLILNHNSLY